MEEFASLYGRLFRAFMAITLTCMFVTVWEKAGLLSGEVNSIKLMVLLSIIASLIIQIVYGFEFLSICVAPFISMILVGIGGTIISFLVPLFSAWIFDQAWSFDVEKSLNFWCAIGLAGGLIFICLRLFWLRFQAHRLIAANRSAECYGTDGNEGGALLTSAEKSSAGRPGLLAMLARNPGLVVFSMLCSVLSFFLGLFQAS